MTLRGKPVSRLRHPLRPSANTPTPLLWKTAGGPCDYTATGTGYGTGTATGRAYEISGGGWSPLLVTVDLPAGATLTVVQRRLSDGRPVLESD
jgi:hypothetical protein